MPAREVKRAAHRKAVEGIVRQRIAGCGETASHCNGRALACRAGSSTIPEVDVTVDRVVVEVGVLAVDMDIVVVVRIKNVVADRVPTRGEVLSVDAVTPRPAGRVPTVVVD